MGYAILCMPHATPDTLVRVFEYYFFIYIYIYQLVHTHVISLLVVVWILFMSSTSVVWILFMSACTRVCKLFILLQQQLVQQDYTYQLVHVYSRVHSMQIMHTSQQQQQYSSTTNSMHTTSLVCIASTTRAWSLITTHA